MSGKTSCPSISHFDCQMTRDTCLSSSIVTAVLPFIYLSCTLDLGTGSGDFANLLAKYFENVLAFDICERVIDVAKLKYERTPNIRFVNGQSICDVVTDDKMFDVILSVTVLDHIMRNEELDRTIQWFKNHLSHKGYVVMIEYSSSDQRNPGTYQRFSTMNDWLDRFSKNGLSIETYYGFYHPVESSCESYELYRKNWIVSYLARLNYYSLFQRFIRTRFMSKRLENVARSSIAEKCDYFWKSQDKESPLHLMIFKRSVD